MGRPTKYNDDMQARAQEYLSDPGVVDDLVPCVEGLAEHLGISVRTCYNWGESHEKFLHTLEGIKAKQKRLLIQKGLGNEFNSAITRLMLANHGLSEKQILEHSGSIKSEVSHDLSKLSQEELDQLERILDKTQ